MCVISKPISHQELETIAIVASSLITTVVNDEIAKKGSNRTGTTTIKGNVWKLRIYSINWV